MFNRRFRVIMRWIHMIGAVLIGTFVYSPWGNEPIFLASMRFVVIPILVLTGVALWQQAKLVKWFKNIGNSRRAVLES